MAFHALSEGNAWLSLVAGNLSNSLFLAFAFENLPIVLFSVTLSVSRPDCQKLPFFFLTEQFVNEIMKREKRIQRFYDAYLHAVCMNSNIF